MGQKNDFRNHSYLNQKLSEKGLFSIYHTLHQVIFGKENQPTFFMHHNLNKSYHIDYCYCSKLNRAKFLALKNGIKQATITQ